MRITVTALVEAPMELVWESYVNPDDIVQWNAASEDWHTTTATVDLRPGGTFCSRMEAKDGSFGFDFEGTYTKVIPHQLIAYSFGDRQAEITFVQEPSGVTVSVEFDAEDEHSVDEQRSGWQAILDRFARHVEAK